MPARVMSLSVIWPAPHIGLYPSFVLKIWWCNLLFAASLVPGLCCLQKSHEARRSSENNNKCNDLREP